MSHVIVVDLGYGDAGKGTVVDWLCSRAGGRPVRTVVRFNGGAQAAHNVVTPDGRQHSFAQFGSGTFRPGVTTFLSRFMLVNPVALAAEAGHLASVGVPDALDRLVVDRDALLTTPYHQAANRARELARGQDRHGSCGMGVGETVSFALAEPGLTPKAGDCVTPRVLIRKLSAVRDRLTDELGPLDAPPPADVCAAYLAFAARVRLADAADLRRLLHAGPAVFEGAQGVLLDEWRGFHPYTTWSTTTFANADELLAEAGQDGFRLGVTRSYQTRHGPGPFVTEDQALTIAEPHNGLNPWQGSFRLGHLDAVALRYAIEVTGGVDGLALTHLDSAASNPGLRVCRGYRVAGQPLTRLIPGPERDLAYQAGLTRLLLAAEPVYSGPVCSGPVSSEFGGGWAGVVEQETGVPVVLRSAGPTSADKTESGDGRCLPGRLPQAA